MAKRRPGETKQGVRDLNHLKGRPGLKLEAPPKSAQVCKHTATREVYASGDTYCPDCGQMWDWHGQPW